MPWFKVHVEIIDDPKMVAITDAEFRLWIAFMALARDSAEPGTILLSDELIAWRLRREPRVIVDAIARFASLGMAKRTAKGVLLPNFKHRQWGAPSNEPSAVAHRVKSHRKRGEDETTDVTRVVTTPVTTVETSVKRVLKRECIGGEVEKELEEEEESAPPALNAREGRISPHDPDPPASPGALAVIGPALESLLGRTVADGELRHIREHLRIGYSAEQIASALRNVAEAKPRPRAPFPAALSLVRSVKPGEKVPPWADTFEKPKPVAPDPKRCAKCPKPAMGGSAHCATHTYETEAEAT